MINLVIPFILQIGFATITLDDNHIIDLPFIQSGTVAPSSGFLVSIGEMADIQSSLHGNSCLIRVSEIKAKFELETLSRVKRCNDRLDVFRDDLEDSRRLNEQLKKDLKEERKDYKHLLYGSILVSSVLSASVLYMVVK